MHVWHYQLPSCILGFKKYLTVSEEFTPPPAPPPPAASIMLKTEGYTIENYDLKYKVTRFARDNYTYMVMSGGW